MSAVTFLTKWCTLSLNTKTAFTSLFSLLVTLVIEKNIDIFFGFLNNLLYSTCTVLAKLQTFLRKNGWPAGKSRWLGRLTDFLWDLANASYYRTARVSILLAWNTVLTAPGYHWPCPWTHSTMALLQLCRWAALLHLYGHRSSAPLFCVLLPGMMKRILQHVGTV